MSDFEQDPFFDDAEDDARAVAYIRNYLPQEVKPKFTEEELYYFLDVIAEYYTDSGVLDAKPDKDGCIELDVEKIANYLVKQAKEEKVGDFSFDDLLWVVHGEMEYAESVDQG